VSTKVVTGGVVVKSADRGEVRAVVSTFGVLDRDGDVVLAGAIKDGTPVVISAYGHASHGGALPVGRGTLRTTSSEAVLHGQFFMNTTAGRDTFEVVKQLGDLGEWSYSLQNVKGRMGQFEGQTAHFIESVDVKEASPVLLGAGVGTRTLTTKTARELDAEREEIAKQYLRYIRGLLAI
jgi:hypothetical protein